MLIATAKIETINTTGGGGRSVERLVIDGDVISNSHIYRSADSPTFSAYVDDLNACAKLSTLNFARLNEEFGELVLKVDNAVEGMFDRVRFDFEDILGNGNQTIVAILSPSLPTWSKPWSFNQYFSVFRAQLAASANSHLAIADEQDSYSELDSAGIEVLAIQIDVPVSEIIDDLFAVLHEVHGKTERELAANVNRGSLVTFFDFPPSVKVACEQYLQYFVQFLDDLGIAADSEISSEAGRVLFSVTPSSGEEALVAIKQALAVYLELPSAPNAGAFDPSADPASTQLVANIHHLQGQLMMAKGALQLSQATVQMQASHLAMYQSAQLVQPSPLQIGSGQQPQAPKEQNSESLFGDTIKVVPLAMKGVEVNLPKLLRLLKRKWRGTAE